MMQHWWTRVVLGSTSVHPPAEGDDRPGADFEARWRPQMKTRLLLVLGGLALWVVGIEARLVFLQVVSHKELVARAASQSEKQFRMEPPAARGDILDRNGGILAYSVEGYSLHADPSQVEDLNREVTEICAVIGDCSAVARADLRGLLGKKAAQVVLRDASALSSDAASGIERLIAARKHAGRPEIVSLARSNELTSLRANPSKVQDLAREVEEICAALGDCTEDTRKDLTERLGRKAKDVTLRDARAISPAKAAEIERFIADRIDAKRAPVVSLSKESRRFYPKGTLASHVLGFVGADNEGKSGLEAKFNNKIAGNRGRMRVQVDRAGREIQRRVEREPVPGATAELTIDLGLQHIAERELAAGVQEFQAVGGSIVIMRPTTGEVLAQTSFPTYNPNAFWDADEGTVRDRAVTDTYEPGSTLKIVTAAAALNEGVWKTSDLIDTNPGFIVIQGRKPIDEADRHNYGVVSFEQALIKSSNVGAIRIGQRVGPDLLAQYLRRMGFGQALGTDFFSQARGQVPRSLMSDSTLASISMGYEIGVTPLQMATAVSIVANGGQLIEPHLIRSWTRDGVREAVEPRVLRRAISQETAATLTAIMESIVEQGTGKQAALQHYRVAGKTGTAQKIVNRRYSDTDYNVSFVGFVSSARQPELVIVVVIDTPRKGRAYGGTVAAPIFRRVAEAAMARLGVMPSINPLPPIIVASDRPGLLTPPSRSASIIPTLTRVSGRPVMPDVRGLSLRDALRVTQTLGLFVTSDGSGVVVYQTPAPGQFIDPDSVGTLQLRRSERHDR